MSTLSSHRRQLRVRLGPLDYSPAAPVAPTTDGLLEVQRPAGLVFLTLGQLDLPPTNSNQEQNEIALTWSEIEVQDGDDSRVAEGPLFLTMTVQPSHHNVAREGN
jgi:hypothetical protein